jgi:probable rRNA maturation factor
VARSWTRRARSRSPARCSPRALKLQHLGIEEATDVLSFPIDAREDLPVGVPRQLGDVVLCPQVVGEAWRAPLVHGLLHLLGYEHGDEMERRERELLPEP